MKKFYLAKNARQHFLDKTKSLTRLNDVNRPILCPIGNRPGENQGLGAMLRPEFIASFQKLFDEIIAAFRDRLKRSCNGCKKYEN